MVLFAALPMFGLKIRNWVWLKALKASARNSRLDPSVILKFFCNVKSKFQRCGLVRKLRPASPKVRPRGAPNAAGLYRSGPTLWDSLKAGGAVRGFAMTSGNDPAPAPLATPA